MQALQPLHGWTTQSHCLAGCVQRREPALQAKLQRSRIARRGGMAASFDLHKKTWSALLILEAFFLELLLYPPQGPTRSSRVLGLVAGGTFIMPAARHSQIGLLSTCLTSPPGMMRQKDVEKGSRQCSSQCHSALAVEKLMFGRQHSPTRSILVKHARPKVNILLWRSVGCC